MSDSLSALQLNNQNQKILMAIGEHITLMKMEKERILSVRLKKNLSSGLSGFIQELRMLIR